MMEMDGRKGLGGVVTLNYYINNRPPTFSWLMFHGIYV